MLYWMCKKSNRNLTWPQLKHAIMRNFGGLNEVDTLEVFNKIKNKLPQSPQLENVPEEVKYFNVALISCV